MTPLKDFIQKFKCEEVGCRLIAVVDGEKQYVADILDGGYNLTFHGHKLVAQAEQEDKAAEAAEVKKPKARRVKVPSTVDNDLLAGME